MRRRCSLVALTLTAAIAGAVPAEAKITCDGVHPDAEVAVEGIPRDPVANTEYHVSLAVPRAPHANPWPRVMFAHCSQSQAPGFSVDLPSAGRVEIPLRFSEAGRWRATLMDRGGGFHSLGAFDVQRARHATGAEPGTSAGGAPPTAAILVGAGIAGGAAQLAVRRRRYARASR